MQRWYRFFHVLFQKVSVHCKLGMGRTGTMLACYLAKSQNLSSTQAITEIRRLRPGSIETRDQEAMVGKYVEHINKQAR